MIRPLNTTFLFLFILMFGIICTQDEVSDFPELKGPYLGQKPPGNRAEIFAPGIISTGLHDDAGPAFNRDGTEIFFRIAGKPYGIIATMKQVNGTWTKPDLAPFSGRYPDGGAEFSFDEKSVYFGSRRPTGEKGEPQKTSDIWVVDKNELGYGTPAKLGPVINTEEKDEYFASIAASGNLYFNRRTRIDGRINFETFCSKSINGEFSEPEKIELRVDPQYMTFGGVVDPDEKYMILSITDKEDSYGDEDLYVCFHEEDGTWTDPINLGEGVNSKQTDWMPRITRDGKYMFFVSWRYDGESYSETERTYEELIELKRGPIYGWGADIYWVSTGVIEDMKPDNLR